MDSSQWPQGIGGLLRPVVDNEASQKPAPSSLLVEKKPRPPKEHALNCPRCSSTNTKFCYYNNYSLSQPRYFCKNCRRYWTEGGSLRNVPVGGGSRKNKRCSSSSASSSKKLAQDVNPNPHPHPPSFLSTNPKIHQGQDLNLAYNPGPFLPEFPSLPFGLDAKTKGSSHLPSLDLLKPVTFTSGQSSFMSSSISLSDTNNNSAFCSSLPVVHDLKSSLGFSLDGLHPNVYTQNPSRLLFPFDELKQPVSSNEFGQEEANGYWNGVLDGGSW